MTRLIVFFALILTACGSAAVTPTPTTAPTATQTALIGYIDILIPQADTQIYHELLVVSGTAADLAVFKLKLVGAGEQILTQITVEPIEGAWCVEIPHGYTGVPMPVKVVAAPTDGSGEYASVDITLAGFDNRPDDSGETPYHPC